MTNRDAIRSGKQSNVLLSLVIASEFGYANLWWVEDFFRARRRSVRECTIFALFRLLAYQKVILSHNSELEGVV